MKKRILVIEDNIAIQSLITEILVEEGYAVISYGNENSVFDKIVHHLPDAILLDVIAPTLIGTELCRTIKNSEVTKNIPVIVLSTHPKIEQVKAICADEVVDKPFDIATLLEALKDQLLAAE